MENEEEIVFDDEIVPSTEDGDEGTGSQKIQKLKDKIKGLEKEKAEYLDGWQRARADYANLQKMQGEEKIRMRGMIEENFIGELLPVVDSFGMAMNNKEAWEKVEPTWRTGVEYIYSQLMNTLREYNLSVFGQVGEVFNPSLHEAVKEVETEDKSLNHTIAAVLQQGYKLGENVLRAARVSVYSKK